MRAVVILAGLLSLAAGGASAQVQPGGFGANKPAGFGAYKSPAKPAYGAAITQPKPIAPLEPTKSYGGAETFKPFKGQHTDSNRGGLDPYPHTKPRGLRSTYGSPTSDR